MPKLINVWKEKFSVIPNEVFWDRRLDYRCRGLLCTLVSLPNGWEFSVVGLAELVHPKDEANSRAEGKDAIRAALQRLEELGYLERIMVRNEKGGFLGYDYKINIPPVQPNN